MQFRSATIEDKIAIIDLLKTSLGESTIPKSELLWNWKHEQNPFGPSYVLLAEENGKLTGLRAFMQWKWQWKGKIYNAIRAVDTATHRDFQGRGIFKKLTLHQVGICKQEGISFIFNTPNAQSKPGYLKMGWVEQGKLPLKFTVLRPVTLVYSRFFKEKKSVQTDDRPSAFPAWNADLTNLIKDGVTETDVITSHLSPQYISWRYEKNPLFSYSYFTDHANFLLIYRIKVHSFARELRLVEFIKVKPDYNPKHLNKTIKDQVLTFCKTNEIDFISLSGLQYSLYKQCFAWMGIIPVRAVGPAITLKDLNMNEKFAQLLPINDWGYSIGDLELF